MMNTSPIKRIEKFATDRGIDKMKHDAFNYSTNVIEELLELIGYDVPKTQRSALRSKFENFVTDVCDSGIAINENDAEQQPHDTIDAIADVIVFSITELQKLNVDPSLVLIEVSKEISSRNGRLISGKFEKYLPGENGYVAPYVADYSVAKS